MGNIRSHPQRLLRYTRDTQIPEIPMILAIEDDHPGGLHVEHRGCVADACRDYRVEAGVGEGAAGTYLRWLVMGVGRVRIWRKADLVM